MKAKTAKALQYTDEQVKNMIDSKNWLWYRSQLQVSANERGGQFSDFNYVHEIVEFLLASTVVAN